MLHYHYFQSCIYLVHVYTQLTVHNGLLVGCARSGVGEIPLESRLKSDCERASLETRRVIRSDAALSFRMDTALHT